ncbi:hypothetical protein [uncultured Parasphingopyxis sp.]|uniref:hypothetical protein n=1 Tax=uncultured Parasphingopyxis sp. TaxID=1547918 RepID=UPI002606BFB1|nr:hypothetical protein [uncultured Parasphingopyxis sp.]
MRYLNAFLLALAAPLLIAAADSAVEQRGELSAPQDHMVPFAWMVGEWQGEGWMLAPNGERLSFESQEIVSSRLSGAALLVEGRHHEPGHSDRVVHDAMAMITWDAGANEYRFRTALANGRGGNFLLQPTNEGFNWRMDTPRGQIVYTIEHDDGVWTERGEIIEPGGRSIEIFGMTLHKSNVSD